MTVASGEAAERTRHAGRATMGHEIGTPPNRSTGRRETARAPSNPNRPETTCRFQTGWSAKAAPLAAPTAWQRHSSMRAHARPGGCRCHPPCRTASPDKSPTAPRNEGVEPTSRRAERVARLPPRGRSMPAAASAFPSVRSFVSRSRSGALVAGPAGPRAGVVPFPSGLRPAWPSRISGRRAAGILRPGSPPPRRTLPCRRAEPGAAAVSVVGAGRGDGCSSKRPRPGRSVHRWRHRVPYTGWILAMARSENRVRQAPYAQARTGRGQPGRRWPTVGVS